MGTPDFSVPVLGTLIDDGYEVVGVVTQPDRPKGRKKVMTPPPVKEIPSLFDCLRKAGFHSPFWQLQPR